MKFMRVWLFVVIVTLVACGDDPSSREETAARQPDHPDVSEVIARNTAALGGEPALDAVRTMVKRSVIEEGEYRNVAVFAVDRQGRMRIDIFADGERVFAESFDGQRGHQWQPTTGQTESSARGTIALSHTPQLPNHIFRLKDITGNGHQIELVGSETIDNVVHHVLKVTLSDGFENYVLVDSESGLVTRSRNKRAYHVDIDDEEKVIESRMSDFRRVGDIVHPFNVVEVDLRSGEDAGRVTMGSLDLNKELPDRYFNDLADIAPEG